MSRAERSTRTGHGERRRHVGAILLAGLACTAVAVHAQENAAPAPPPAARRESSDRAGGSRERDHIARLERPDWGKVIGWVLDVRTRRAIPNARVAVEIGGAFPESGKGTDRSDERGKYEARAPLGNITRRFDWGRALTMHPLSLLFSPTAMTKQTRMVDVTQVNVRVEAGGYQPFLGRVRATRANAAAFSITLDDVWLAPAEGVGASFSPERVQFEVIERLMVEPEIVAPGEKVRITLITRLPLERGQSYEAFATSSALRLLPPQVQLKAEKEKSRPKEGAVETAVEPTPPLDALGTRVTFRKEVTIAKNAPDRATEIGFFLVRNGVTALRRRETRVLLQVVPHPEDRPAAVGLANAHRTLVVGDRRAALAVCDGALRLKPDYRAALLLRGDLLLQLNRPGEAAAAFQEVLKNDPDDHEIARTRFVQALVEAGRMEEADQEIRTVRAELGKKNTLSPELALCQARVSAAAGDFDDADHWLSKAGQNLEIPPAVLTQINLQRMEAAIEARPRDADLRLSYARVLEEARRREAALEQRRKAVELDNSQPWPFLDLGTALWDLGRREEGLRHLEHARQLSPNSTEIMLALASAYRDLGQYAGALPLYRETVRLQPHNLRARHYLALMLFAGGDQKAARTELLEVVAQARAKGDVRESGIPLPGIFGSALYFGPKRRLAVGFSVPEAAADAAILEALQDLEKHPNNGLLWQNIGSALLDLDLPELALSALQRSQRADPTLLETRFLLGVARRKRGELESAREELQAVVAGNPLHPRAHLELAQLYTDLGELERAQAELAAHARNYPFERPARPTQALGG